MSSSSITLATSGNAVCRCNSRSPAASRYVLPMPCAAEVYDRDGSELVESGLYIDHSRWHFNVFELQD